MKQQQKVETSSVVFSILLLITMLIVIFVQLAILLSYAMTSQKGRCVFIDSNGQCACKMTNHNSCKEVNGIYNGNLTCNDGYGLVCTALQDTTTTIPPPLL